MRRVLYSFYRWVFGLPTKTPRPKLGTWVYRVATIAFLALVVGFLLLGPGVVLLPLTPRDFQSLADPTYTVYYQKDEVAARDVLRLTREAQNVIVEYWGRAEDPELFRGIKIYLAETREAYFRLTMNRAGGSAMFGSVIVINMSKAGQNLSLVDFLRHELAHIYLRRRLGYFQKHLTVPAWFDEGCAVRIQGDSPDTASLGDRLEKRPRLLSVTSLRYHTDWETMVFMEESRLARQHYGYVGVFVEFLENRYGIEKIREYLSSLSWGNDPEEVFASVFGIPLAISETQCLSELKVEGDIPEETELIAAPIVPRVLMRWTLIFGGVVFMILWAIRNIFRLSRFVSAGLRHRSFA